MSGQKVAIITGAGSGIGAATAKRFANDGFRVVLNGRTESKLIAIESEINKPEATFIVKGDVSSHGDVKRLIEATIEYFGQIDVLVNNAAIAVMGSINEVTLEQWQTQMTINIDSIFLTIKESLPYLEESKGNIVNVSSVSGLGGDWGLFSYNATKGAVSNMTRALAMDLGSQDIRVNAVAPSLTRTEMTEGLIDDLDLMKKFSERIPMGRAAESDEVADVIAFLASHDARFVNGVILPIDGGLNASNGQPKIA